MELRNVLFTSIKVFLVYQILILSQEKSNVSGQLDLPALPGPPYPDPRGQNRWGVKFDPRKHGPPFDTREGPSSGSSHRNTFHKPRRRRPSRGRQVPPGFWKPGRGRPNRLRRRRPSKHSRLYGNSLKHKRPRHYAKVYEEYSHKLPSKPEEQQFWNAWNAWYKKQADHKANKGVKSSVYETEDKEVETATPITFSIDINNPQDFDEDDGTDYGNYKYKSEGSNDHDSTRGGKWKERRDYYMKRMKDFYSKAKSYVVPESGEETIAQGSSDDKAKSDGGWKVFTTIGKGIDAASGAVGSVKKVIGGSVVGTGIKYGGQMAMNVITNVGTSAITKAIIG